MTYNRGIDIKGLLQGITDSNVRQTFDLILRFLSQSPFLQFRGRVITIDQPKFTQHTALEHFLGFRPTDAFVVRLESGSITLHHAEFTDTHFYFSTGTSTKARVLVGTFGDQ